MFLDLTSPFRQCIVRAALANYAKQQAELPACGPHDLRMREATSLVHELDDMMMVDRRQHHPAATFTDNTT